MSADAVLRMRLQDVEIQRPHAEYGTVLLTAEVVSVHRGLPQLLGSVVKVEVYTKSPTAMLCPGAPGYDYDEFVDARSGYFDAYLAKRADHYEATTHNLWFVDGIDAQTMFTWFDERDPGEEALFVAQEEEREREIEAIVARDARVRFAMWLLAGAVTLAVAIALVTHFAPG